jgi:ATP-dependent Lon protease
MTDQKPDQKTQQTPAQDSPQTFPEVLPVLPLKGTVVLPFMVVPLGVGRPKSLAALEAALSGDRVILLVAQKQDDLEDPSADDLFRIGTICKILQVGKQADGTVQVVVEGAVRGTVTEVLQTAPFFQVRAVPQIDAKDKPLEVEALMRGVTSQFERYARLSRSIAPEAFMLAMSADEARQFLDAEKTRIVRSTELESITGLTRYDLSRQFRIMFGTSPYRYLLMRRLDFARERIHRDRPLAEVACDAGFADQAHFARAFKSAFGLTPGRYRALRRALPAGHGRG